MFMKISWSSKFSKWRLLLISDLLVALALLSILESRPLDFGIDFFSSNSLFTEIGLEMSVWTCSGKGEIGWGSGTELGTQLWEESAFNFSIADALNTWWISDKALFYLFLRHIIYLLSIFITDLSYMSMMLNFRKEIKDAKLIDFLAYIIHCCLYLQNHGYPTIYLMPNIF